MTSMTVKSHRVKGSKESDKCKHASKSQNGAALSIPLRCFSILLQNTMDLIPEYVLLNGIGEDKWE
jgi:hypothetical protein